MPWVNSVSRSESRDPRIPARRLWQRTEYIADTVIFSDMYLLTRVELQKLNPDMRVMTLNGEEITVGDALDAAIAKQYNDTVTPYGVSTCLELYMLWAIIDNLGGSDGLDNTCW